MAHIYIYSPAGAVRDKATFKLGVTRLKALGHELEIDAAALTSHQRFAGDDATRLAAIERAASSGADMALITRGGYGLSRSLPLLPYKKIARSIEQGMQWVGYSDFTALQAALFAKTMSVTWAGPALCEDFGCGASLLSEPDAHATHSQSHLQPDDIMQACFDDLLQGICEGTGWRLPVKHALKTSKIIASRASSAALIQQKGFENLNLQGTLWGGNLAMLTSLLGTPYLPKINKGILWFEDVGEHPYKIERMLLQWLHAGILQRQKALIFGQFSNYKLTAHDKGFKLQTVMDRIASHLKIPVLQSLPFGHVPTKVCLPFGQKVRLLTEERDALLYWG